MTDEPDDLHADHLAPERVMLRAGDLPRDRCDRCNAVTVSVRTSRAPETVRLDVEPHRLGRYIVVEPLGEVAAAAPDLGPIAVQVPPDTATAIRRYIPPDGKAPTPLFMAHDQTCPYGPPKPRNPWPEPAAAVDAAAAERLVRLATAPDPGLFEPDQFERPEHGNLLRRHDVDTSRRSDVETS